MFSISQNMRGQNHVHRDVVGETNIPPPQLHLRGGGGDKYRFIETLFKGCFDISGNVLVYNMYESTFRCRNSSNCKKVTPSQYCNQLTGFTYKL